jgi:hypothetical protein
MDNWAILATGESMSADVANNTRHYEKVIAVSDAFRLAPWAFALVAQDRAWWKTHQDAFEFAGRKFSACEIEDVERIRSMDGGFLNSSMNSGLLACHVAQFFGAKRIDLYGFDLQGSHYFGSHPAPLKNTSHQRYQIMIQQFENWNHKGIEVYNMSPNSALKCFKEPCNA